MGLNAQAHRYQNTETNQHKDQRFKYPIKLSVHLNRYYKTSYHSIDAVIFFFLLQLFKKFINWKTLLLLLFAFKYSLYHKTLLTMANWYV